MNQEANSEKIWTIIAFASTYIIWGSTYMANKVIVMELPPFFLAGIRFMSASLIIFIIGAILKMPMAITKEEAKNSAIAGFLFLTFGNGLAVWALKYVESAFTAIIISTQPLILLIMMRIIDNKKIKFRSIIGVGLGVLGIYVLVSQNQLTIGPGMWKGLFMLLLCLIGWGWGSIFVAKAKMPSNAFINGAWQMLFGGGMMFVVSILLREDIGGLATISNKSIWSMLYLIVFGSIVAFTAFNYLLQRISPEKVATNTYVNPVVAMFCGWYFLGERVTWWSVLATLLLFTGVYFINSVRFGSGAKS